MMAPLHLLLRDAAVVTGTVTLWALDASLRGGSPSLARTIAGVLAGVSFAVSGFILHEWGHLAGARWTGSRVHFAQTVWTPLLFHFDVRANTRRQFLAMSLGGYAGTALGLLALALVADASALSGRVAIGLTVIGVIVTLVAELPTTVRVWMGGSLPDGYAFRPPNK
jgi:hypothetical protein